MKLRYRPGGLRPRIRCGVGRVIDFKWPWRSPPEKMLATTMPLRECAPSREINFLIFFAELDIFSFKTTTNNEKKRWNRKNEKAIQWFCEILRLIFDFITLINSMSRVTIRFNMYFSVIEQVTQILQIIGL